MSEMSRARRHRENLMMAATRTSRRNARRSPRRRKSAAVASSMKTLKAAVKPAARAIFTRQPSAPPEQVLYRICKPGWAVVVEKTPNAQGTRFVCPFCPRSHRVPGPVRGFRKMRRLVWIKLRRVEE